MMNIQQLEERFRRRGYTLRGSYLLADERYVRILQLEMIDTVPDDTTAFTQEVDREFANGQHHMVCCCGAPFLVQLWQEDSIHEWRPPDKGGTVFHRSTPLREPLYRLVSTGPDSTAFTTFCPTCGRILSESLKEIQDEDPECSDQRVSN